MEVNADWGYYNAISNGGDIPKQWRVLSMQEWTYLFEHNKWTMGIVAGTLCFLLIPDNVSDLVEISSDGEDSCNFTLSDYESNSLTAEQFQMFESQGVVALPCGGYRTGSSVNDVGIEGCYWSSSANESGNAYKFCFNSEGVYASSLGRRFCGFSVRLVQDV